MKKFLEFYRYTSASARLVSTVLNYNLAEECAEIGTEPISLQQFAILEALNNREWFESYRVTWPQLVSGESKPPMEDGVLQQNLAHYLHIDAMNISTMLKRMEEKGLVKKAYADKKWRANWVSATEHGREVYRRLNSVLEKAIKDEPYASLQNFDTEGMKKVADELSLQYQQRVSETLKYYKKNPKKNRSEQ